MAKRDKNHNGPSKKNSGVSTVAKKQENLFVKFSVEVVIGAVILVALLVAVVVPTVMNINETRGKITEQKKVLEDLRAKVTSLTAARTLEQTLTEEIALLDEAVPNKPEFVRNFKILERIASDLTDYNNNFILKTISLSQVPQGQWDEVLTQRNYVPQEMTFNVAFNADFMGAQKFVEAVSSNLRNFEVLSVSFGAAEQNNSEMLSVSMNLKTIYYGD